MTAYVKSEKKSIVIDAQMASPREFKLPVFNLDEVKRGPKAIGVPGFLKGMWEIHQKYGTVPWKDLVVPIMNLCRGGLIITKHLHDSMHINKIIVNDPYLKEVLVDPKTKTFKRPGTKVFLNKNCDFLETLANHTESEIFSNAVGEIMRKDFIDAGRLVTLKDLQDYKVKWSEGLEFPLSTGDKLLVPNTAAVLIPSVLNILQKFNFNASSFDGEANVNVTIQAYHRIVEAFKHVFAVRSHLGDPEFIDVNDIVKRILSPQFAEEIRKKIDEKKTFNDPRRYATEFIAPEDHGTSHVSIATGNGDAVSITSSINY